MAIKNLAYARREARQCHGANPIKKLLVFAPVRWTVGLVLLAALWAAVMFGLWALLPLLGVRDMLAGELGLIAGLGAAWRAQRWLTARGY